MPISTSLTRFSNNCKSVDNIAAINADIKTYGSNIINILDSVSVGCHK